MIKKHILEAAYRMVVMFSCAALGWWISNCGYSFIALLVSSN
jgi:hypothetical protein